MEDKWPNFLGLTQPKPSEEPQTEPTRTADDSLVDLPSDPLEWDSEDRALWEEIIAEFDSKC